jgi:hypothetical protein
MHDWSTVIGYLAPILIFGPIIAVALFFIIRELVRWVPDLVKRSDDKQTGPKVSKHVQKVRGRKERRRRRLRA